MFYIKNKILNFLEYRTQPFLNNYVKKARQKSLQDIGIKKNGNQAPRALVIYVTTAIPYYIQGNVLACPLLDAHAMIWESAEIVHQLIGRGYVVDFIDCYYEDAVINWEKYALVIDERNNLIKAPAVNGQVKIYYSTGLKWDFHNAAEIKRAQEFHQRHQIWLNPGRTTGPVYSDIVADHMTYFGNNDWLSLFSEKPVKHQLDISVTYVPEKIRSEPSKRDFMWMGSVGALHKGLDLAVEAFIKIPQVKLHVFGPIESDQVFFNWFKTQLKEHNNIIYQGTAKIKSETCRAILSDCIGHVYPSCSEGGPGSVAQTSHFGIIPITTRTANVRSAALGYVIDSTDAAEIILSIEDQVKNLLLLSDQELKQKREALISFSRKVHTREAYSESFNTMMNTIGK